MKEITIKDVRDAIVYVQNLRSDLPLTDEQLMKADFLDDLGMGNIRTINVYNEVQRRCGVSLPVVLFKNMKNNTVGEFLRAANEFMPA